MRFTVNDASQCAAAGVGTRSSNSIFDSASQTPPPRMHSAIASVGLDFSSDGAGLFPKRAEMTTTRTHYTFRVDTWTPDGESIVEHRGQPASAHSVIPFREEPLARPCISWAEPFIKNAFRRR